MEGISISEINDAEVSNDSELTWFQRFEIWRTNYQRKPWSQRKADCDKFFKEAGRTPKEIRQNIEDSNLKL